MWRGGQGGARVAQTSRFVQTWTNLIQKCHFRWVRGSEFGVL